MQNRSRHQSSFLDHFLSLHLADQENILQLHLASLGYTGYK